MEMEMEMEMKMKKKKTELDFFVFEILSRNLFWKYLG